MGKIVQSLIAGIALAKPEPIKMTPEQEEAIKEFSKQIFQLENNKLKSNLPFIDPVISATKHKETLIIIPLDKNEDYRDLDLLDAHYYKALHLKWILEQCGCKFEDFHVRFSIKNERFDNLSIFPRDSLIPEYEGDTRKVFLSDLVMHLDVKEGLVAIDRSKDLPVGLPLNYGKLINAYEAA